MATMICTWCGMEKPLTEFHRDNRSPSGLCRQCKSCLCEKSLKYYKEHREERQKYTRDRGQQVKQTVLSHYSDGQPKCTRCGFEDIRALTIDHINGGGNKQRRSDGLLGANFFKWLICQNYPKGLQVLCMNCQFIKKVENGENCKVETRREG